MADTESDRLSSLGDLILDDDVKSMPGMSPETAILERKIQEQAKFAEINKRIFATLDLDEILTFIAGEARNIVGIDRATFYLVDKARNEVYSRFLHASGDLKEIRVPISRQSIAGFVAMTGQLVNIKDVYDDYNLMRIDKELKFDTSWDKKSGYRTKSMLVSPVKFEGETIGVIQLINKLRDSFDQHDEELISEFSNYVGLAVHNANSHQELKNKIKKRLRLDDVMVEKGYLSQEKVDEALSLAKETGKKPIAIWISEYGISDKQIIECKAAMNGVPFIEFEPEMEVPIGLEESVPEELCFQNKFFPLKIVEREGRPVLNIAIHDSKDIFAMDNIEIGTKMRINEMAMATFEDIKRMIRKGYHPEESDELGDSTEDVSEILAEVEGLDPHADVNMIEVKEGAHETETPITKLVDKIIEEAYRAGASDIHVEPFKTYTLVRYRKDGALYEAFKFPAHARAAAISRIKIIANLDISEKRKPQDGRIKFKVGGKKEIELRVAVLPTVSDEEGIQNEDVVMRILAGGAQISLTNVGFIPRNWDLFNKMITQPYGMVLVVGPTGSGKTTTLYSGLSEINTIDRKILTAEDPVEIRLDGARQVQVKAKIGYTFAAALRSFLRCDPNVVLVGEIRDEETAEIAIKAALTGHLVFSTLHTNNAPATVTRLVDMGINPFNLCDALLGVLAQRLTKRLCGCKEKFYPTDKDLAFMGLRHEGNTLACSQFNLEEDFLREKEILEEDNRIRLFKPAGCSKCRQTGLKGRVAVHELLEMRDSIKDVLYSKGTIDELRKAAIKDGMWSLYYDGLYKVLLGNTNIEEVMAECGGKDEVDDIKV